MHVRTKYSIVLEKIERKQHADEVVFYRYTHIYFAVKVFQSILRSIFTSKFAEPTLKAVVPFLSPPVTPSADHEMDVLQ